MPVAKSRALELRHPHGQLRDSMQRRNSNPFSTSSWTAPLGTGSGVSGSSDRKLKARELGVARCRWLCQILLVLVAAAAAAVALASVLQPRASQGEQPPAGEGGGAEGGEHVSEELVGAEGWPKLPAPRWHGCAHTEGEEHGLEGLDTSMDAAAALDEGGNRYLMIQLAGGLNQMRAGVCDAVVAAYLMRAVLVLPFLDNTSWWADGSTFADVFDAHHFSTSLAGDVQVVPSLPQGLSATSKRVPRFSTPRFYANLGCKVFRKHDAILLTHFDSRLADNISAPLQKPVRHAAQRLLNMLTSSVGRIRSLPGGTGDATPHVATPKCPFVALHLRYEPDMLAFTGCDYGGTEQEKQELARIRQRWPNLPPMDPQQQRAKGMCVTTPAQVAVALRAMGIPPAAPIYVASGALFGGPKALLALKYSFVFDKQSANPTSGAAGNTTRHNADGTGYSTDGRQYLAGTARGFIGGSKARKAERQLLSASSQIDQSTGGLGRGRQSEKVAASLSSPMLLAAVDYEVCRRATLFVANNNGNMARLLTGHRRYDGAIDTIKVHGSKVQSLLAQAEASWNAENVERLHGKLWAQTKATIPGNSSREGFYAFPSACLCSNS